jgi:hypothetical protein
MCDDQFEHQSGTLSHPTAEADIWLHLPHLSSDVTPVKIQDVPALLTVSSIRHLLPAFAVRYSADRDDNGSEA